MSVTKYLQHVGINYNTYNYWRKKLKENAYRLHGLTVSSLVASPRNSPSSIPTIRIFSQTQVRSHESGLCTGRRDDDSGINKETHKAAKEYLWMVRAVMERLVLFHYDQGSRAGAVIESLGRKCSTFGRFAMQRTISFAATMRQHRTWLSSAHCWQHAGTMMSIQETI